jgi:UPF0755 protein
MTDLLDGFDEAPVGTGGPARRRWPRVLISIAVAGLVVAGGAGFVLVRAIDPPGGAGAPVSVLVPPGASGARIAAILDAKGVISSGRVFRLYTKVRGAPTVQAGEYRLRHNMAMGAVVRALRRGPAIRYARLTVPEGLTLAEVADRVGHLPGRSRSAFVAAVQSGAVRSRLAPAPISSLEGLLFPDTYLVTEKEDETAILRRMVERTEAAAAQLDITARAPAVRLTPYQVLVAASLVEAEAKVPEDRPLIASVIENRLARAMPLQVDATVLYALGRHKTRVLFKDLEVDSPYNTYKHPGLPPTPIGAPGTRSIEAVLRPAQTQYLYYVLIDPSGKHGFATTSAEFERLKADARRRGVR